MEKCISGKAERRGRESSGEKLNGNGGKSSGKSGGGIQNSLAGSLRGRRETERRNVAYFAGKNGGGSCFAEKCWKNAWEKLFFISV